MIQKQTVYLPVKIEDELPKYPINIGLIGNKIPMIVNHLGNGKFKSVAFSEKEINRGIESYLKYSEAYVFTPEQLNEYTANVIKSALETAAEKAEITNKPKFSGDYNPVVDEESITDTFEETFKIFSI